MPVWLTGISREASTCTLCMLWSHVNSVCGRLLKERRDLCFYSKNLAHEYLQAVLDSDYYSVCLAKLVALGVPIGSALQWSVTACLKITWLVLVYLLFWGVCFVLFLSVMCGIPGRCAVPALDTQDLETKKQPRMALKETQVGSQSDLKVHRGCSQDSSFPGTPKTVCLAHRRRNSG